MKLREFGIATSALTTPRVGTAITDWHVFVGMIMGTPLQFGETGTAVPNLDLAKLPNWEQLAKYISCGDGPRTVDATHYHPVAHRGHVDSYLHREKTGQIQKLELVVMTTEAFTKDPETTREEVRVAKNWGTTYGAIEDDDMEFVLVAVLASSCPTGAPMTVRRLVSNLAGNNAEVATWSRERVTEEASRTLEYDKAYCVVADIDPACAKANRAMAEKVRAEMETRYRAPLQDIAAFAVTDSIGRALNDNGRWVPNKVLAAAHRVVNGR